jgi:hypothetical protein
MATNKFIIIFMFLITFSNTSAQNFKIITSDLARELMGKQEPVLVEKMDRNDCYVYKTENNGYLVYSDLSN